MATIDGDGARGARCELYEIRDRPAEQARVVRAKGQPGKQGERLVSHIHRPSPNPLPLQAFIHILFRIRC